MVAKTNGQHETMVKYSLDHKIPFCIVSMGQVTLRTLDEKVELLFYTFLCAKLFRIEEVIQFYFIITWSGVITIYLYCAFEVLTPYY